jgi:hypothetical protein
MAPSLRFSSVVLLAASWMLAAGCGDDDTSMFATGGSSGHAGAAGAHAGSGAILPGAAGAAGSSGSGAASGSSGTDAGGAAGEGGEPMSSGGSGVSGGTSGGTGGASGGTSGASGGTGGASGGTGGTAGTAGAPNTVKNCAYQCATDDDCKISTEIPQLHFCHPTRKRCEDYSTPSVCDTSSDCVAFASLWIGPCVSDGECFPGDVCIAFAGRGVCATPPDPDTGCALTRTQDAAPMPAARFGAAGNIDVCTNSDGLCVDKACQYSCRSASFGGCSDGTQCNAVTGLCDCSASTQCPVASTKPLCGADSHCGCATSDQCASTAGAGFDKCYSGSCGCSSAAACPASPYENAPPVCE